MNRPLRILLPAVVVVAWFFLPVLFPRFSAVLLLIPLYIPIVVGLSLLSGFTGQVSLGQASFYGTGAYTCAIATTKFGLDPWLGIVAAVVVTMLVAAVVGWPLLVLRGHYLVIGTLALNVIVVVVFREWRSLTGGPNGLSGVPQLSIAGVTGDDLYFPLATVVALLTILLSRNLVRSRSGRALQAIASSETAAETLAVATISYKIRIFVWAAALAGVSGALYAQYLSFVSPSPFGVGFSVLLLVMAVVGGVSSIGGAVLGTALVVMLRELFREFVPRFVGGASPEYEIVLFGLLLAFTVIFVPAGVWPWLLARLRPFAEWMVVDDHRGGGQMPTDLLTGSRRSDDVAVRTTAVTKQFGGLAAVDDVSLEVTPGQVFAIIGPNGAGKTTLLNLLSGVLKPTAGKLEIAGQDVTKLAPHEVAELGVARTFQKPQLFPLLDVIDNVKIGVHRNLDGGLSASALRLTIQEERRAHEIAQAALELVGIGHLAHEAVDSLPFGRQRLVELARAVAMTPDLLLLDEPASGLSHDEREGLRGIIGRIRETGVSVVLVEHDVPFIMALADRVLVLHHGRQIAFGPPHEVRNDPIVIEAYLGSDTARERRRPKRAVPQPEPAVTPRDWLLAVDSLDAAYGAVEALHGLDVHVRPGEVVAVVGRNGAGKSTFMRCVSGLLRPSSGTIIFDGTDITRGAPEHISRMGISLVPERRELFGTMSAGEHLGLGSYVQRRHADLIAADRELVERLFPILADRRAQRANSMSGGQQQMVAIARSLMAHPRLLLLDEPTLGLAPKIVEDILGTLQLLLAERPDMGVVIVEQNTSVLPIVDRVYVLEGGRTVLHGDPEQVRDDPAMQAAFLGKPVGEGSMEDPLMDGGRT